MEKKLSIIIPVYNIKDYIINCVENLILQRCDYEIILVDDGSSDETYDICNHLEDVYLQVSVIHTQHNGVSAARNIGLNKACGKYIYFVDGDDIFCGIDNLIEQLDMNFDKLYAVPYHIISKGKELYIRDIACNTNESIDSYANYMQPLFHACWGYVFPLSLIHNNDISFHEGVAYAEDWAFTIQCLSLSDIINPLSRCYYKYTTNRDDSAMNKPLVASRIYAHFLPFYDMSKYLDIAKCKSIIYKQQVMLLNYVVTTIKDNISKLDVSYCAKKLRCCVNYQLVYYAPWSIKIKFILVKIHINLYFLFARSIRN